MKVERIVPSGIFRREKITCVGKDKIISTDGIINNKEITVYRQYLDNKLVSKLYFLSDKFGNFLKLKLVAFTDGEKKVLLKQSKSL